ncbi:MAG: ribonuclease R [Candidatus Gracilibacteria bacterium]|nr:ribonuclease R [Candidatus Gracilibacteria bacterium]
MTKDTGKKSEQKKFYKSERKSTNGSFQRKYTKKKSKNTIPKPRVVAGENEVIGIYAPGKGDYGFVDVEIKTEDGIEKKGYYVFGGNARNVLQGDRVLARVKSFRGKEEAEIIQVIAHRKEPVIGVYKASEKFGFVTPKNPTIKKDIFVPGKYSLDAKDGEIVAVEITAWESKSPEGQITKILGKPGDKGVDILGIAMEAGTRIDFGRAVDEEVRKLSKNINERHVAKRKDLRNKLTITIDGPDSKDLDDAISVEEKKEAGKTVGYKLYVHIADVAHYVKEDHAIDKEARRRGTSTYLVNKVIPMLPETLSNGLCSLNPHEEKLTLTAEMDLNLAGHITRTHVYESVTKSDFRMTYKEVDQILAGLDSTFECSHPALKIGDELMFGGKISQELVQMMQDSEKLRALIAVYKKELGVLEFNFPESKIEVDDDGNPIEFKKYTRYHSSKIIEEFMIVANEAVSKKFQNLPFLYRVHEKPSEEDVEKLYTTLAKFSYNVPLIKEIEPKDFQKILDEVKNDSREKLLSRMVLRSMTKAQYSPDAEGHFGLALNYYSHFTSPIRRYPDLQIHRIIKEQIHRRLDAKRKKHYDIILDRVAKRSSEAEVKAEKLEYKVRDLMACKYMKNHIGKQFSGVVAGVIGAGIFVELENTIEGFVELNNRFEKTDFVFDADMMLMENSVTGVKYTIGDKVQVQVKAVKEDEGKIDFEIVM